MNTSPSRGLALRLWYTPTTVVLIISLLAWAVGLPGALLRAEAAQLTDVRDALSSSRLGVAANHTVTFGTPTGILDDGSTVEITIPGGFDMSFIGEDDIDIADDGVDLTTDTVCGSAEVAISTSSQTIIIEFCNGAGGAIAASSEVSIEIGTNASASGSGVHQIQNHSATGDYAVSIGGTMGDEGATRIVIVDAVYVTGEVDNYLDFEIMGVNAGEAVNADPVPTVSTTTATSVPFGLVSPSTEYLLAQDLSVNTNSMNGFTVTVSADSDLTSTTGATINSFTDGTGVASPIAWVGPDALAGSTDTYGHWGVTTEDVTLSDDDSFGSALYAGNFIGTPREVMYATSSADGTTPHIGLTRVGYKLEVSALQEAATDYTTQLTYIATPVF